MCRNNMRVFYTVNEASFSAKRRPTVLSPQADSSHALAWSGSIILALLSKLLLDKGMTAGKPTLSTFLPFFPGLGKGC